MFWSKKKKKKDFRVEVTMREQEYVPILSARFLSNTHGMDDRIEAIIPRHLIHFGRRKELMQNVAPFVEECMKRAYDLVKADLTEEITEILMKEKKQ
jgi:hypothetical protein